MAHNAEVVAAAKRDLESGEEFGGGGGYTIYGLAADVDRAVEAGYVPFELLDGAEVIDPIEQNEPVTWDTLTADTDQPLCHFRALQDL